MTSKLVSLAEVRASLSRKRRELDHQVLKKQDEAGAADDLRAEKGNLAIAEYRAGNISEHELELRNIQYREEMKATKRRLEDLTEQRDNLLTELQNMPSLGVAFTLPMLPLLPTATFGIVGPLILLAQGAKEIDAWGTVLSFLLWSLTTFLCILWAAKIVGESDQ